MNTPSNEERIRQAMQTRAVTIQFLRQLEDELIVLGVLLPDDRACLTRQERRLLERPMAAVDSQPLSGV